MSSLLSSVTFLRAVVWFDAATGVLLGALHLAAGDWLAAWLGLPPGLVLGSGLALLGFAALAASIARAPALPRGRLWVLVVGNAAWALGALALLAGQALQPTLWGTAYLLVHVVSVALLAELQWFGLRRAPVVAWA